MLKGLLGDGSRFCRFSDDQKFLSLSLSRSLSLSLSLSQALSLSNRHRRRWQQWDQIGRFLKVLGVNFYYKISPNILRLSELF